MLFPEIWPAVRFGAISLGSNPIEWSKMSAPHFSHAALNKHFPSVRNRIFSHL
ncbi:hypothetical protein [Rubritalea tangerina]|uniref:hypothetical protein n=1 Tax=Rubritalea tangerina TaxID=430798 RepID=UPI003608C8AF